MEKPNMYLIVKNFQSSSITQGIDPVTGDEDRTIIPGGLVLLDTRKTLEEAMNVRYKKYPSALIIPAY
jgi:hypothetical protein